MASILDSPHIHKRRWRGGDAAHTRGERETMMMMMHMAKISPLGALQAATAAATAAATGRRRAALAITVWIR